MPNTGQPIPAPGTEVSFTVTATSTTDSSITKTQTETFTVPEIDAVSLTSTPTSLSSSPGVAASTTLTLQNDGNVPETVTLTATTPAGVTADSLAPITLAVGATQTETLTLTPDASSPLNQTLATTITASFGPSSTLVTTTDTLDLLVQSAQAAAVSQASIAAGAANNSQLASVLTDLSNTLAMLQSGTSAALFTEAQNDLNNLNALLTADPALTAFVTQLQPIITAANADNLDGMLSGSTSLFNSIAGVLNVEATEQFTASLSPTEVDLLPGQGQALTLTLTNTASDSETLNLSTGTLPIGVTVQFGQSQVNLAAGASTTISVTLSQTIQSTTIFTLGVTANAGAVRQSASTVVSITPAAADVTSVTATPQAVSPGTPITVSAQVFNTANATRSLEAQLQILNSSGNVVSTAPVVPFSIDPNNQSVTVNLGSVDTTGLANGQYNLKVNLLTSVGTPLPGTPSETPFLVGIPVSVSVSASPGLVAPGSSTVTTTIQAQSAPNASSVVYNNASGFSITGNPNGVWSYGYLSPGASPDSSTFTPYTNSGTSGGLEEWWDSSNPPAIFDNPTSGVLNYGTGVLQPGEAGFHPGPGGQYSVYRFTAPATGSYSVSAVFTGIDDAEGTTTDVHVLDDGTSLFQGNVNGYLDTSSYTRNVNLTTGDTIDFAVGFGSDGSFLFDSTGLDATVTLNGSPSGGQPSSSDTIDLYFTEYAGSQSVNYVPVTYNGSMVTLGSVVSVATNVNADGLIFLPNGNLMTANGPVTEVNPITGQTQTVSGGPGGDHLALDPSGQDVWSSPQPGELEEIPIDPLSTPIGTPLTGDAPQITAIAFDAAGNAYYTSSGPGGYGDFGTINLTTFTTKRYFSDLPAAHGIMFDPFTGDIIIVGSSDVTQIDPTTMTIVGTRDFSSFGDSQFDQGAVDGQGHLYVADNNGHLLFVDYSQTGNIADTSDIVASPYLANYLDDVAPLSGLGATGISLYVEQTLPAAGYTVDPTTISPNASSVTSSQIDWEGSLSPSGTTPDDFALSGTVADMAPGEVRQISDGTTVNAYYTTASGQVLTVPITFGPVSVAAEHIISLTPDTQTADLGTQATFTVQLTNPYSTGVTYDLSTVGLDGFSVDLASSVMVPAGQTVTTPLVISVPLSAAADTTGFEVLASTTGGVSDSVEGELTVAHQVVLQTYAVSLEISPTQATAGQGTSAQYVLTVSNVGSAEDTYSLSTTGLPSGVTATFGETSIDVPPGVSNFRDVPLTVAVPKGTTPGRYPFTVTATSTTDPTVTSTADGTLTVTAGGVQVTLNPGSGAPGSNFQATVTNTGTTTDTYNLALAGPAALVSTLGMNQVTLAPGASRVVPISTGAVDFAVEGNLGLTAAATSTSNPAIQNAASADLAIPATHGMTAEFSPASQTLSSPGMATFLLMVHNTGNAEDSYSATIMGTNGPVTATLVGLDGSPTQSIPTFILPGLSTGAIELQVDLSAVGQGTVTVQVKSLTNGAETASPDAVTSLSAIIIPSVPKSPTPTPPHRSPAAPTDGPKIDVLKRYGYHAMPLTLVLTFDQALDPATAEDVHNYRIVSPDDHRIKVSRAVYDPASLTVTLHFAERISVHHPYQVTVIGTGLEGVRNPKGQLLDGDDSGRPGADYYLTLTWRQLVLGHVSQRFLIQHNIIHTRPRVESHPQHSGHHSPQPFKRSWSFLSKAIDHKAFGVDRPRRFVATGRDRARTLPSPFHSVRSEESSVRGAGL